MMSRDSEGRREALLLAQGLGGWLWPCLVRRLGGQPRRV